jgi:uncharacterized membrane protein YkvA (DUF1232 family)
MLPEHVFRHRPRRTVMSLRVSFDLSDKDLEHFALIMHEARKSTVGLAPEDIVAEAETLLHAMDECDSPGFIAERIQKLRLMIQMLSDVEWRLPHQDATRVLNALAYFSEPEDLIPDGIPGLGYLDDAIMIELVVRELNHEIDAYENFCEFRNSARANSEPNAVVSREAWLDERRKELQSQMRRRRKRNR